MKKLETVNVKGKKFQRVYIVIEKGVKFGNIMATAYHSREAAENSAAISREVCPDVVEVIKITSSIIVG